VKAGLTRPLERVLTIGRLMDLVPVELEGFSQEAPQPLLIVYDQDARHIQLRS